MPLAAQDIIDAVNEAELSKADLVATLTIGKLTVQQAKLGAQIAAKQQARTAANQATEAEIQALQQQAAAVGQQLQTLVTAPPAPPQE